jgi:hypothetical protein
LLIFLQFIKKVLYHKRQLTMLKRKYNFLLKINAQTEVFLIENSNETKTSTYTSNELIRWNRHFDEPEEDEVPWVER